MGVRSFLFKFIFNKMKNKPRVIVAMSGGVDSAVAAALLEKQGYDVIGVFMKFWADQNNEDGKKVINKCCSLEAAEDARKVAEKLGFPFYVLNFKTTFKEVVVDDFLKQFEKGYTPNPCIRCNKFVKFGALLTKAKEFGAQFLATGHYAQITEEKGQFKLLRGKDKLKDQSYFLYNLGQKQLKHLLFPVGGYTKEEVRKLAKKFGLHVYKKLESQEICFVPFKKHNLFLKKYLKLKKGLIKTVDGKIVGEHEGLPLYTLGQRKGIRIGGIGPFYVVAMDHKNNTLIVSNKKDDPCLFSNQLIVQKVNWLAGTAPELPFKCDCSIRYHHSAEAIILKKVKKDNYLIKFSQPQRAITPGQSAVFYKGNELIGGGVIRSSVLLDQDNN